jgi:hypothetical protein
MGRKISLGLAQQPRSDFPISSATFASVISGFLSKSWRIFTEVSTQVFTEVFTEVSPSRNLPTSKRFRMSAQGCHAETAKRGLATLGTKARTKTPPFTKPQSPNLEEVQDVSPRLFPETA